MSIEIRNIQKAFGRFKALKNINLDIAGGELVALLGPSGCGKTTLLRIIAEPGTGTRGAPQGEGYSRDGQGTSAATGRRDASGIHGKGHSGNRMALFAVGACLAQGTKRGGRRSKP